MDHCFTAEARRPLQEIGTHWRLVPPQDDHGGYRLVAAWHPCSPILRPSAPELAEWSVENDLGAQPLRLRIEVLPALAPYGSPENVVLADFTGWKYCELGEPESDREMDYSQYEKFAMHDLPLDRFHAVTLMILIPPAGKSFDLSLGQIEAWEHR